jgi:acyl carrier protein
MAEASDLITKIVLEAILEHGNWLPQDVLLTDDFIRDLRMGSDDLTALVLDVEKQLGVNIPIKEWKQVHTVADACNLLRRYSHLQSPDRA